MSGRGRRAPAPKNDVRQPTNPQEYAKQLLAGKHAAEEELAKLQQHYTALAKQYRTAQKLISTLSKLNAANARASSKPTRQRTRVVPAPAPATRQPRPLMEVKEERVYEVEASSEEEASGADDGVMFEMDEEDGSEEAASSSLSSDVSSD